MILDSEYLLLVHNLELESTEGWNFVNHLESSNTSESSDDEQEPNSYLIDCLRACLKHKMTQAVDAYSTAIRASEFEAPSFYNLLGSLINLSIDKPERALDLSKSGLEKSKREKQWHFEALSTFILTRCTCSHLRSNWIPTLNTALDAQKNELLVKPLKQVRILRSSALIQAISGERASAVELLNKALVMVDQCEANALVKSCMHIELRLLIGSLLLKGKSYAEARELFLDVIKRDASNRLNSYRTAHIFFQAALSLFALDQYSSQALAEFVNCTELFKKQNNLHRDEHHSALYYLRQSALLTQSISIAKEAELRIAELKLIPEFNKVAEPFS